jgi:hypothetical protein
MGLEQTTDRLAVTAVVWWWKNVAAKMYLIHFLFLIQW